MNHLKESAITKDIQKENIKGEKALIYNFFKANKYRSFTTQEVEMQSGATIKNCHKRISELIRDGLIMSGRKVKTKNGYANCWILSSPEHIEQLKKRQLETDYKNWVKMGLRFKELIENESKNHENGNNDKVVLVDVFSFDELKIGDKVTIRFAQRYDRNKGWSEFYDADYLVKHNEGKSLVFEHCIHKHTCHRMYNVGNRNSKDWIVGKHIL